MNEIKKCRACDYEKIETFFNLGNQPFANALLKNYEFLEDKYPLVLCFCPKCNLVQLNHTADPKVLFSNYYWLTSTSSTARSYAKHFCDETLKRLNNSYKISYILEIASNDGTFLKEFQKKNFEVLGVDSAQNISDIANSIGVKTKCGFFGQKLASAIISEYGFPGIIIVRNVLPHVANLHDFLQGIFKCVKNDCLVVIEVHYLKKIIEELHYDSIYHEHLCYFSLNSLERLLNSNGLYIFDIMESQISGGSIVVFLSNKKDEKQSQELIHFKEYENNENVNNLQTLKEFAKTSYDHKNRFNEILKTEKINKRKVVGYGASARSSTMLNFCNITQNEIMQIADKNQLKHNLYTPGSHIPITSPEKVMNINPDTIVILAWNFLDEIIFELKKNFAFQGRIIIPLPYPPVSLMIEEL